MQNQKEKVSVYRSRRKKAQNGCVVIGQWPARAAACPETMYVRVGNREAVVYELFVEAAQHSEGPKLLVRGGKSRDRQVEEVALWELMAQEEVYHRIIKSGCRIEDRQLETADRSQLRTGVEEGPNVLSKPARTPTRGCQCYHRDR